MRRRGLAGLISWASIVLCIFIIIISVAVGLETKSWIAFLGVMGIAATVAFFSGWFDKKVNPQYVAFTRDRVEIDVPGKGRILILDKRQFEDGRLLDDPAMAE